MSGKTRSVFGSILTLAAAFTPVGWTMAGLLLLGAAVSYDAAKRMQVEAARRARAAPNNDAIRGTIRGSHEHLPMVCGMTRIGGLICTIGTSSGPDMENQYLHIGIEHSVVHAGGCEGITAIYIDEVRVPVASMDADPNAGYANVNAGAYNGLVRVRHYRGTGTQVADTDLVALAIDVSTDYRRGIAWTYVRLKRPNDAEAFREAYKHGLPNISVELKGIRVYDPRKDSTNGGAGTHRTNDPLTWEWSDNPILCAATYSIMNQLDGGEQLPAARILWSTVASDASECEEVISTPDGNTNRYRCNGALVTSDDVRVNLRRILDSCLGERVPVGGQFAFHASKWRTETFAIDATWLAGPVEIEASADNESLYNYVRVNFNDAAKDYKTVEAVPYSNSTYETEDGGPFGARRLPQDLTLPMVSGQYHAQSLSQIFGKRSRMQKRLVLPCNLKALDLELQETGTVTLPNVDLAPYKWRVEWWEPTDVGANLVLVQDASTVYDLEAFTVPADSAAASAGVEVPPAPTAVSATAVADGIALAFTPPAEYLYSTIQVARSSTSGGAYSVVGNVARGATSFLDPVTDGATWFYKLRCRATTPNFFGPYSSIVSATAKQAASSGSTTVFNPGFEDGDAKWTKEAGWSIVNDANKRSGSWCAKLPGTGSSVTAAIKNQRDVPVAPGDLVLVTGFLKSTASANGTGKVRIRWKNSAGADLSTSDGNALSPSTSYAQSRVSAAAPASAASAVAEFLVASFSSAASEAWYADDAYLTVTPRDQDEVPDGTIYGRPKLTALTAGEVDLAKAGVIGRNLGNIADDATYGRTKLTALTSGEVDLTKAGVLNKSADNIAESGSRKWAAESGADVTAGKSITVLDDVATTPRFYTFSQTKLSGTAQTVTIPTGARTLVIRAWGGGGGGRTSAMAFNGGGGGGGTKKTVVLQESDWGGSITYTVGVGGAPGSPGVAGGNTTVTSSGLSFTNLNLAANGGGGGGAGGGAGGTASGGDTNVTGSAGSVSPGGNSAAIDSIFGKGAASGVVDSMAPGGGGGGGDSDLGDSGGPGADGQVTFTWSG